VIPEADSIVRVRMGLLALSWAGLAPAGVAPAGAVDTTAVGGGDQVPPAQPRAA